MKKTQFVVESHGATDVGLVRDHNEDYYFIHHADKQKDYTLLVVADGMGGHEAGEVASELSVRYFVENFKILKSIVLKNIL